ncbi:hypothetical protein GCM10023191_076610 [Actinoallomurus oryzae]|uniref:Uncharacterized protein n=1 Tax=Actinoallomurus oryzae TaxID=502180 RepID=A0ABP8QWF0_9ACTN
MDDDLSYSMEARVRVALSASAAEVSTLATSLVPTHDEYGCPRGELAELSGRLVAGATEALMYAVACERRRGTSWERIAEVLDEDVGAVRRRFEEPVARLDHTLVEAWLDPGRAGHLPEGADDPVGRAERLDRWLTGDSRLDDAFRHHPDSEIREHPVSAGLAVMSLSEHYELLASAARVIDEEGHDREATISLHRRRIALLEWLLAEELLDPEIAEDVDEGALRTLLTAARRRLARL